MACEQRIRTQSITQTSKLVLPRFVTTEQQSVLVVKKLLAIAVSSITYLRGLFPKRAYRSKYIEEQKVMILREERTCPGSSQIVQWLQGCFDALQRQYLRMILLCIYSDPEFPHNVTECYQFKIHYTESGPELALESKKQLMKMDGHNIKKASILLVRKLYTLIQHLGPLPNNVCINMKLSYYDDVTPYDYQPPGFKDGENSSLLFEKEPVNLTMGEVVTPFHSLKVSVTTERERMEQVDNDEPVCTRDRWPLRINENILAVSKVHQEFVTKENIINNTGIDNSDLSKEKMLGSQDDKADVVAPSTGEKQVSRFQFPLSQESLTVPPKRRKCSVPKENH